MEGKKIIDTHILILIPSSVNNLRLNLNYFEALLKKAHNSSEPFITLPKKIKMSGEYQEENLNDNPHIASITPLRSYWVLMTRDCIPYSENKSFQEQLQLLQEYKKRSICRLNYTPSSLFEGCVSTLSHYTKTNKYLLTIADDISFSRCMDPSGQGSSLSIGNLCASLEIRREFHQEERLKELGMLAATRFIT